MNTDKAATAFNEGSDARLAGQPLSANPYHLEELHRSWRHGWLHVDRCWGIDSRWAIMRLRPVREEPQDTEVSDG